jgi:hypothetical protein
MNLKLIVAVLLIALVPAYAQAQSPSAPNVGDAQKVVTIISGDKAKTQAYCDIQKLALQIEEASKKKDHGKTSCTRKLEHWKKSSVPNMSHGPMVFRTSRKTTSSLRSLCAQSQHSIGCVRIRSQKSEGARWPPAPSTAPSKRLSTVFSDPLSGSVQTKILIHL